MAATVAGSAVIAGGEEVPREAGDGQRDGDRQRDEMSDVRWFVRLYYNK
jgi:hypothetical protein